MGAEMIFLRLESALKTLSSVSPKHITRLQLDRRFNVAIVACELADKFLFTYSWKISSRKESKVKLTTDNKL